MLKSLEITNLSDFWVHEPQITVHTSTELSKKRLKYQERVIPLIILKSVSLNNNSSIRGKIAAIFNDDSKVFFFFFFFFEK